MASAGVNVLRYSALGGGVLYGYTHQASITAKTKILQAERERAHQASIKEKAHEAFVRRNDPKPEGNGVITDPDDSRFDLEAYLNMIAKENP